MVLAGRVRWRGICGTFVGSLIPNQTIAATFCLLLTPFTSNAPPGTPSAFAAFGDSAVCSPSVFRGSDSPTAVGAAVTKRSPFTGVCAARVLMMRCGTDNEQVAEPANGGSPTQPRQAEPKMNRLVAWISAFQPSASMSDCSSTGSYITLTTRYSDLSLRRRK